MLVECHLIPIQQNIVLLIKTNLRPETGCCYFSRLGHPHVTQLARSIYRHTVIFQVLLKSMVLPGNRYIIFGTGVGKSQAPVESSV